MVDTKGNRVIFQLLPTFEEEISSLDTTCFVSRTSIK